MTGPAWVQESSKKALTKAAKTYRENIKQISECLALHDNAERVLEKHVNSAVSILDAYGHTKKPWYQRYESEVGLGGLFLGWIFSVDEAVSLFWSDGHTYKAGTIFILRGVLCLCGCFLVVHGLMRARGITAVRH